MVNRSKDTLIKKQEEAEAASGYLRRCVISTFPAQTGRKTTHTLQSGADGRQEVAQHPLLVRPGPALKRLQADAAQRVAAAARLKTLPEAWGTANMSQ